VFSLTAKTVAAQDGDAHSGVVRGLDHSMQGRIVKADPI
jgi:hypothetical protein